MIEWLDILFIIGILIILFFTVKLIEKKTKVNAEIERKMIHVIMGLTMLSLPYLFKNIYSVAILAIIAIIILLVLKKTKLKKSLGSVLYSVNRESLGEIFFVISVFVIFYLSKGDKVLYSIPILILTFADSAAALIGKEYGKNNLAKLNEDAKSIEGSFAFFVVAFMATLAPLLLYTNVGREEVLIISTIVGFNVALIEMISHNGNDNLLIPLTTFALLTTHISMEVEKLRENLIIIFVIFIITRLANKIKSWSKLALIETLVVGYMTITLYGIYAVIPPLTLFLTCMRFPKMREKEKDLLYDARIIETNVIIGIAICGIVAITGWKEQFFMIYSFAYCMHLAINTFVRLKYYFDMSEADSLILSFAKSFLCITLPSIVIQKICFNTIPTMPKICVVMAFLLCGLLAILIQKRDVKEEEISIKNGYLHLEIVFILTAILSTMLYFKII